MQKWIVKYKKPTVIILIVCIYFTLLALVSFIKAPSMDIPADESFVNVGDMTVLAGDGSAWIDASSLYFDDSVGTEKIFSADIQLSEIQRIMVRFNVNCPNKIDNTAVLRVDLYADGYDSSEQEFTVNLENGQNEVCETIDKGRNAPEQAQLRIFCLDAIQCEISSLSVQKVEQVSHGDKRVCIVGLVILTSLLLLVMGIGREKRELYRNRNSLNYKTVAVEKAVPNLEMNTSIDPFTRKKHKYLPDIACAGIMFCVIFVLVYNFLGFSKAGIGTPWSYLGGDDFTYYTLVKAAVEDGWIWSNARLGAPYGSNYLDQSNMLLMNTEILAAKILGIFVKDIVTLVNIQYLLTFCWCGLSAFFVLRIIKIGRTFAMFGGLLFALSPYIFVRAIGHYCLGACYFVPFSILLCIWATESDSDYLRIGKGFFKNKKNIATIIIAILIANNGIGYYPFFTCFFLCVTALCNVVSTREILSAKKALTIIGCIVLAFALTLLPVISYQVTNGSNTDAMQRGVEQAEIFGLKIVQLFVPTYGHGTSFLNNLIEQYNTRAPLVNENVTAYLGLSGILGFLLLLLYFFVPERAGDSISRKRLRLFSRFVVCAILFATIGGFSSLLALFFRALRGYNRISIFIRFICICALCIILQQCFDHKFKKNDRLKKGLLFTLLGGLTVVCLFDQLPPYGAQDSMFAANASIYESDDKFIKDIECQLQADDMVFQLPYHAYPESGPVNAMSDYQHLTGYIHSKSLKWSYGGMKGREGDTWYKYVASLSMEEMIETILSYGFRGIYIDTRAYAKDDLIVLQNQIEEVIGCGPTISENGALLFYNLYPYLAEYPELAGPQLAEETNYRIDMGIYKYTIGETVYFDGTQMDAHKYFTDGMSGTESDFAWTDGNTGKFALYFGEEITDDVVLQLRVKMIFNSPQMLIVECNGNELFNASIADTSEAICITIPKECVENRILNLDFQFPDAISPISATGAADTRELAFAIENFSVRYTNIVTE